MKYKKVLILLVSLTLIFSISFSLMAEDAEFIEPPANWDESYDVVVIGGGFAGLAAAYNAQTHGANTVLIEKMPFVGGNSQINGGVYASYTSKLNMAEKVGYEPDTPEQHIEDTIKGGDYMSDPALVKNFVYGAPYFLNMMIDNGLELREALSRPGGHYGYRTHNTINQSGSDIVLVQKKMVEEAGVDVMLETEMNYIYREAPLKGKVLGIRVKESDGYKNIKANNGVILASGGFSGNEKMRKKYVPWINEDMPTTNHVGATGEGIKIAQQIGADTLQMSYIQLYPFANPNNGVLDHVAVVPFSGPSFGIVYVDTNGERYVNEGERRDVCSMAAMNSGGFPTFAIFNENMMTKFTTKEDMERGIERNRVFKAETLEELVGIINSHKYADNEINIPAENLINTIEKHNDYVRKGEDPDFDKRIDKGVAETIEEGPYYAIPQWPSVHHTMGGLKITPRTEVQDMWGNVIPGLYAAGEVVGGVHGTNRLGSNAIPDAAAHGLIAGQKAADGTLPEFVPEENR